MQVEFHNRANTLFFSVYHGFENAVASLSRRKEEFKFQQLKKQYAETLQRDLQMVAKDILRIYKSERAFLTCADGSNSCNKVNSFPLNTRNINTTVIYGGALFKLTVCFYLLGSGSRASFLAF